MDTASAVLSFRSSPSLPICRDQNKIFLQVSPAQTHHVTVLVDLVVVGDLCDLLDEGAGLVEHAGDLLDQLEGELAGRRGAVNRVWKMEP